MKAPAIILIVLGLAAVFGWMTWQLIRMGGLTGLTGGSTTIGIMIAVGVIGTAVLTGVLMRLAFFSSRKGYDEVVKFEARETPTEDPTADDET